MSPKHAQPVSATKTVAIATLLAMSAVALTGATAARARQGSPSTSPPAEQQIAAAVAPLPKEMRDGAAVLGYGADGKLGQLRAGSNGMVCLADNPADARFHVACYHETLEPFMARGRALRAAGARTVDAVDSTRFAEVRSGALKMPTQPASLYSLTAQSASAFDAATGVVAGAQPLHVVYIPGATARTTGLSVAPQRGSPWLMNPGTPKAHIMFVPNM